MMVSQTSCRFQSTSPTRGDDICASLTKLVIVLFQSTSPTRGDDPLELPLRVARRTISIHVPYERGRRSALPRCLRTPYFNPRPLREGTTVLMTLETFARIVFQSTSPTRGDDVIETIKWERDSISIHVPYERGRRTARQGLGRPADFNPRPLREGTT